MPIGHTQAGPQTALAQVFDNDLAGDLWKGLVKKTTQRVDVHGKCHIASLP